MHEFCPHCGFSYEREPGFYLGAIYLNYGVTVILTCSLMDSPVNGTSATVFRPMSDS